MEVQEEGRSARKHRAILEAAAQVFLDKGYLGTSMEEIATLAAVSKQTVYKHFADKERLFAEIILATTDQIDRVVHLVADMPVEEGADRATLEKALCELARQLLTTLMQPRVLQLRRLIISNADRFPDLGRAWYEQGFERVLATLAETFRYLTDIGQLDVADAALAADHFVGLLLWIPVNKAMFHGEDRPGPQAELDHFANAAAQAFLRAYAPTR